MSATANRVRRKLSRLRRNIRWMFVAHGMAYVTLTLALALIWHYVTDSFIEPPQWVRAGMLGVVGFALLMVFLRRVIYPLTRKLGEQELALLVEHEYPLLNDRLITALQLARDLKRYEGIASSRMMDEAISEGLDVASRLRFKEVVQSGRLLMATGLAMGALGCLGGLIFSDIDHAELWVKRLQLKDIEYPRDTQLDIIVPTDRSEYPTDDVLNLNLIWDADARIARCARGSGLRVIAKPHGEIPDNARIMLQALDDQGKPRGDSENYDMESEFDAESREVLYFHFNLTTIPNESSYELTIDAGDASESLTVVPVRSPALAQKPSLSYDYPAYMRKARVVNKLSYEIAGPTGTNVEMSFETDAPLAQEVGSARVLVYPPGSGKVRIFSATPLDDSYTRFGLSFALDTAMVEYELELRQADGLRNMNSYRSPINVEADGKPDAAIKYYGESFTSLSPVPIVRSAVVPMQFTIADRYGVESRALRFKLPDAGDVVDGASTFSYPAFSKAFDDRGVRSRAIGTLLEDYEAYLRGLAEQFAQGKLPAGTEIVAKIAEYNRKTDSAIQQLRDFDATVLIPLGDETGTAWDAFESDWEWISSLLADNSAKAFDESMTTAGFEKVIDRIETTRRFWRSYAEILHTGMSADGVEQLYEFNLPLADLLNSVGKQGLLNEEQLAQTIRDANNTSRSLSLLLWLEARDANAQARADSNLGRSTQAKFDLVSQDEMKTRISRHIREQLQPALSKIIEEQIAELKLIEGFQKDQRPLTFGDKSRGDESRKALAQSQIKQSSIPEKTKRLAESFARVGFAFSMNNLELETGLGEDRQADRIHISRIVLRIMTLRRAEGDRVKPAMQNAREAYDAKSQFDPPAEIKVELRDMLATMGLWRPTGEALLRAPSSVKRIRAALPINMDLKPLVRAFGTQRDFTDAASLTQLDELFKNVLRESASLESRRSDLGKIVEKQKQTLAGLEIVREQLKKWEAFDSLVQEMKALRDLARRNADDIKRRGTD